jgi:hypothetical protein
MNEMDSGAPNQMDPGAGEPERSGFPAAFVAGLIVMAMVVGIVLLFTRSSSKRGPGSTQHLPFGPSEQAYAPQIHFQNLQLAHADNLLNQEFIYVNGVVSNDGNKTVGALEMTVEFHDPFNQVILRETQQVFGPPGDPLKPGQQHDFQVTLERKLPSTWNQLYPSIRVTGLSLK